MSKRYFFHRPPVQAVPESRVMNDLATADVDSVVQIAAARCDDVCTQGRLWASGQDPLAQLAVLRALAV